MFEQELSNAYQEINNLNTDFRIENWAVVQLVHQYRMYWKPENMRTILLAESHLFTETSETMNHHNIQELAGYPTNFVRFVYCLSCGDNNALTTKIKPNNGTPQFWKLFNELTKNKYQVSGDLDQKIKSTNKINLLNELKNQGIWLLDASIVALYHQNKKPGINEYKSIIETSFSQYCLPIIQDTKPKNIVVIGKMVHDSLTPLFKEHEINNERNIGWIHAPNAKIQNNNRKTLADLSFLQ